jgi:ribosomal protein S18 acetylase RimI-like enzyme
MAVAVTRLLDLPAEDFGPLLAASERAGWRFLRRLVDEWANGTNRFDRRGETLLAARVDGALAGVCGLNIDPYAGDLAVGRVRRLYVLRAFRCRGVGQLLLQAIVRSARASFRCLHVRTENGAAARLYERLGFVPVLGGRDCTHTLMLDAPGDPGIAVRSA